MREIKFRGKRLDNGEWVYGYLFITWERAYILWGASNGIPDMVEVDPATVGQYAGLKDKNGVEIWEGDIINSHYANIRSANHTEAVVFCNGKFTAMAESKVGNTGRCWALLADGVPRLGRAVYMEYCVVIGNIHDNPELLEKYGLEEE